jgi:hypothetical protein
MSATAGSDRDHIVVPLVVCSVVPARLRKNPAWFWTLWTSVFALLSGISLAIAWQREDPRSYLGMCLPIAFGFISVPAAFKFCHARLVAWAQNVNTFAVRDDAPLTLKNVEPKNWVLHELSFFGGSVGMYAAGIILGSWSLFAFYLGNYFDGLTEREAGYLCCLIALSAGLAGFGLDAIFRTSRLIWRFGRNYRIVVREHKFGVLSTGRALGHCFLAVAVVAMIYYSSAILGLKHLPGDLTYRNAPLLMLSAPTLIFIFASFVVCQIPLHLQMIDYKKNQLTDIETILDQLKTRINDDISSMLQRQVGFFEGRRAQIMTLPEWPFGFNGLLTAIGSSIVPLVPSLIGFLVKASERMVASFAQ